VTLRPSALSDRWPQVPLGEAVEFLDHRRKPITASERVAGPYPYYGANGQQDSVAEYLFDEPLILLAEDGGHFDDPSRGVAYGVTGKCWVNNHAHVLRPRSTFDFRFLCWHLAHYDISEFVNGTTRAKLTKSAAERIPVMLPPLPEQRRIADILDKADAIRRKRKEAIALTEELLRSAFLEMFGDPVTNPKGWPVKPLGDVVDHLDAGWSANGDARERTADEFGVLKVSAVTSGIFRAEEHKAVPASAIDRELVTPRRGDLLFSRANTRELVAATCLVERDEPRLFLPDKLWRVVPRADAATAPYLRFLLAHDRLRAELTKTATGTSGSMLNVSMDKLRGLRAPFPPIDLQNKFAALVWRSLSAKAQHQSAHERTEDLFNSLVARAFSGALESSR